MSEVDATGASMAEDGPGGARDAGRGRRVGDSRLVLALIVIGLASALLYRRDRQGKTALVCVSRRINRALIKAQADCVEDIRASRREQLRANKVFPGSRFQRQPPVRTAVVREDAGYHNRVIGPELEESGVKAFETKRPRLEPSAVWPELYRLAAERKGGEAK